MSIRGALLLAEQLSRYVEAELRQERRAQQVRVEANYPQEHLDRAADRISKLERAAKSAAYAVKSLS